MCCRNSSGYYLRYSLYSSCFRSDYRCSIRFPASSPAKCCSWTGIINQNITHRIFPDGRQCLFTGTASHIPSGRRYQQTTLPVFGCHRGVLCSVLLFLRVLCGILTIRCLLSLSGYICQTCLIIRYLKSSDACLRSVIASGGIHSYACGINSQICNFLLSPTSPRTNRARFL